MEEAGLAARMDEIGNVIGRYEGERPGLPCLMLGSHYDTVRDAGKWDGPLGVVTALECVADVARRGLRLPFALEVVGFADEEGVRFSSTLLGSRAIAGTFDYGALDGQGPRRADHARGDAGLRPQNRARSAMRRGGATTFSPMPNCISSRGRCWRSEHLPVGVVTAISGASRFLIALEGMAGHAGTVPMDLRRDALAGAAECVCAVERLCGGDAGLVGTVGQIAAEPGATNVIPGRVRFTIDIRAADDERAQARPCPPSSTRSTKSPRAAASRRASPRPMRAAPRLCAPWLRAQLAAAIEADGHRVAGPAERRRP